MYRLTLPLASGVRLAVCVLLTLASRASAQDTTSNLPAGRGRSVLLPDLVVASLTHRPSNPITGDIVTFLVAGGNIGRASAGPSQLEFRIVGEAPGSGRTLRVPVPALGADQTSAGVTVTQQRVPVAQRYWATATADITRVVAEARETNNVATDYLRVAQIDQQNAVNPTGYTMPIVPLGPGLATSRLAQVVTAGLAGKLVQVRLPIQCRWDATGALVVELQHVDPNTGMPNESVLRWTSVPAATLSGSSLYKDIMFGPGGPDLVAGDRFAIVLTTTGNRSCDIKSAGVGMDYVGGQGFTGNWDHINNHWSPWHVLPNPPFDLAFVTALGPSGGLW